MQDEGYKRCIRCSENKPLDSFHKYDAGKQGRRSRCKACNQIAVDAARAAMGDGVWLARRRAKYAANREAENARTNAWKQANPRHIIKSRLSTRRPDGNGYMVGHAYSDIPAESVEYGLLLLSDPCSYCGGPAGELDHITPVAEGGTNDWWNLTAACRSCNRRKNDRTVLDMLMRLILLEMADNWAPRLGEDLRLKRRAA